MRRPRPVLAALTGLVLAVPLATIGAGAAGAAPPSPEPQGEGTGLPVVDGRGLRVPTPEGRTPVAQKISPSLQTATGTVTAFVQLEATSGVETVEAGGDAQDVEAAAAEVVELAEQVVPDGSTARSAAGAPELVSVTTNLLAGAVVSGDAGRVRALADDDAVAAVHLITPKKPMNKGTNVFTEVARTWQDAGLTGDGITIGVLDTGLDYTHADFGGPGTPEAYAEAYGTDGTGPVPEGTYDPEKYLGGWDFAGPTYDPETDPVPQPDANPIDAPQNTPNSGHGTHVAGTAAGYGVTPEGETFDGDYSSLGDISDWLVGPGSAPEAGLYALKIFGDAGGSTLLTIDALEWSADPNGDGDFNDRLDVINLSIGADHAPADDPENLFIDQLTGLGTTVVVAAGNGTDVTDIGGTPGNARSSLTVANSVGDTRVLDAIEVVESADPALVGLHPAQNSVNYTGTDDVTAPVSYPGDGVDGCEPLTDLAAEIAGTIVYLYWDDNDGTRECGSTARFDNATDAGAVGVLLGTEERVFPAGIAGNEEIPGAQLTAEATDLLMPQIVAETLVVHLGPSLRNAGFVADPTIADAINPGSSRGVHGSLGVVKPDVAAPGTSISSAGSSYGTEPATLSGTSMSSPHVAGIAALVTQQRPGWTPEQIKAAVMNTATHDVYAGFDQTGPVAGPERVGSGRVDAFDAVTTEVIAYDSQDPQLVSVTFGVVDVEDEVVTQQRTVTIRNTGDQPRRFTTAFSQNTSAGGATITTTPGEVTVGAGDTALVTVTLTVDPATLARELDPSSEATYDLGIPVPREFVPTVSGRLVLTDADSGGELRVPVHAAPRPFSDLSAEPVTFWGDAESAPLDLTGRGLNQNGYLSIVAPFNLVATSPQLEDVPDAATSESTVDAADVRYVGFASTAPQIAAAGLDPAEVGSGTIGIGIATQGEWGTLASTFNPYVTTDIDGDGIWDLESVVWKVTELDLTFVDTYTLTYSETEGYGYGELVEQGPVNGLWASLETTIFDNNVLVVPIGIDAAGIEPGDTPTFLVSTESDYAPDGSGVVDEVAPFTADPFAPPFWFDGGPGSEDSLWYVGAPGEAFTVHRQPGAEGELLLLHSHNPTGERAEVVPVVTEEVTGTTTTLEVTGDLTEGSTQQLVATVEPDDATGTVRFLDGETVLGEVPVTDGQAVLDVTLDVGSHALQAVYLPDVPAFAGSSSDVVTVEVTEVDDRAGSRVHAVAQSTVKQNRPLPVAAVVQAESGRPTGRVEVSLDGDVLADGRVLTLGRTGVAAVVVPPGLPVGTHTLTVTYLGNDAVAPSSDEVTVRVTTAGGGWWSWR